MSTLSVSLIPYHWVKRFKRTVHHSSYHRTVDIKCVQVIEIFTVNKRFESV
ncbi:hypothetical protein X975_04527, partial [Stegodyphus mimosarum]